MPSGAVLTIYNSTKCTEPLETWSLFTPSTAYTINPGIVSLGSIASDYATFLSLQIYIPISEGPIQVGMLLPPDFAPPLVVRHSALLVTACIVNSCFWIRDWMCLCSPLCHSVL